MKRLVLTAALAAFPIACTPTMNNFLARGADADKPAKPAEARTTYRAPVLANQISADNAKDKAQALNEELDRDLQSALESRDKDK